METVDVWVDSSFHCPECDDVRTQEMKEFSDNDEIECPKCESKYRVRNV